MVGRLLVVTPVGRPVELRTGLRGHRWGRHPSTGKQGVARQQRRCLLAGSFRCRPALADLAMAKPSTRRPKLGRTHPRRATGFAANRRCDARPELQAASDMLVSMATGLPASPVTPSAIDDGSSRTSWPAGVLSGGASQGARSSTMSAKSNSACRVCRPRSIAARMRRCVSALRTCSPKRSESRR